MAIATGNPSNTRALLDQNYVKTVTLPTGTGGVSISPSLDLLQAAPWPSVERVILDLKIPATPALASAGTLTATIQDSSDDATFTAIASLNTTVSTAAGGGGPAVETQYALPIGTRRYVRVRIVQTGTGDNSAVSAILQLQF